MSAAEPSVSNDNTEEEILARLKEALQELPDRQRQVFNMRYYDELSLPGDQQSTDLSEGALKASYHHAVKGWTVYITKAVHTKSGLWKTYTIKMNMTKNWKISFPSLTKFISKKRPDDIPFRYFDKLPDRVLDQIEIHTGKQITWWDRLAELIHRSGSH